MLLDAFGRPMKRPPAKELDEELSAASIGSVRQIVSGHPADNLRPERLAAILRNAEVNDPTEFLQMAEQFEEKDLHYAAVLGVRKRAVRNLEFQVTPGGDTDADKEAAQLVRAQLGSTAIKLALSDIMDAVGKGFSVCELIWDTSGPIWKIAKVKWRDPSWFRFDHVDGETLRRRDNDGDMLLEPGRFIDHRARLKSGLTIRGGLARLAAWAYIFKNYSLRDWAIFLTAYGHPVRIGKYGTNATEADKKTLLRAMRQVGTDLAAIMPKSMEAEFVNAAVTSGDAMFEKNVRYWDEQLSKGVLGQVATTDAIAGGHAVGKIHEQVRDDIRDADGEQLAATLERDVATPLTAWNFGPNVAVPTVELVAPEEHDLGRQLDAIKTFGPMGMKVPVALVRDRFGIREPEDDEEVLEFTNAGSGEPPEGDDDEVEENAASMHEGATPIERFIERVGAGDFAHVTDPVLAGFLEAIDAADDLDQVRDILADLANAAPNEAIVRILTQIGFGAHIAGQLGVDLD